MFQVSNAHLQEDIVVLTLAAYRQATRTLIDSDGTICCMYTTMSSWRWAFDARNM